MAKSPRTNWYVVCLISKISAAVPMFVVLGNVASAPPRHTPSSQTLMRKDGSSNSGLDNSHQPNSNALMRRFCSPSSSSVANRRDERGMCRRL